MTGERLEVHMQLGGVVRLLLEESPFSDELVDAQLHGCLEVVVHLDQVMSVSLCTYGQEQHTFRSSSENFNLTSSISFGGSSKIGLPSNCEFLVLRKRSGLRMACARSPDNIPVNHGKGRLSKSALTG